MSASGGEEGIPLLPGQRDLVGLGAGADAVGLGGADDRLHAGGVAEDPREQDGFGRGVFGFGQLGDDLGGGVLRLRVGGGAKQFASADGRPRLDENFVATAVVEGAGGEIGFGEGAGAIGEESLDDERGLGEGELELVNNERLAHVVAEEFDLAGRVVAHAEVPDLAGAVQCIERAGDFGGLGERIGAVEEEQVEVSGLQATQDALGGTRDVFVAEIVTGGFAAVLGVVGKTNADFGLEHDAVAQAGRGVEDAAKDLLGFSDGVDVGVIEKVDTALQRGGDGVAGVFLDLGGEGGVIPRAADLHAAIGDARNGEIGAGDWVGFHRGGEWTMDFRGAHGFFSLSKLLIWRAITPSAAKCGLHEAGKLLINVCF